MVSQYRGPDNWPDRWAKASKVVEAGIDWTKFRRDRALMAGVEVTMNADTLALWQSAADENECPPQILVESKVGSPKSVLGPLGLAVSANSIRAGLYAWRIKLLTQKIGTQPKINHVLEIGGGFGALARALYLVFGVQRFSLADAPPMITLQKGYITRTTSARADELSEHDVYDLVTNTNSLGEMEFAEVERYIEIIERQLRPGGVFYSVNRASRVTDFVAYPFGPKKWTHHQSPFLGNATWIESFSVRTTS